MRKPKETGTRWAVYAPRKAAPASSAAAAAIALLAMTGAAFAANPSADQAKRMYDRIAGVPASDATITAMTQTDATSAALMATKDAHFYNDTIRNLAAPWTNRDQSVFVGLNDYTATVIGMVRDDVAFNTLLSADLVYIATGATNAPAYSPANNDMYDALDTDGVDLSLAANLTGTTQSSVTGVPAAATAGVMTTRGAAMAFFVNGTNRAMFRFTMMNHLCSDLQTIPDTTRPPDRIRQDVTRSPGGDSSLFLNNCIECHSGMDPMAQAFAYYNFDNTALQIKYTLGTVQPKYFINNTNFPQGYVTPDDHWNNRWRDGVNAQLGWNTVLNPTGSGSGAKSLGMELENSTAFANCQVTRVFKYVCLRTPGPADATMIATMVSSFKSSNYKLRQVFADAAVNCMGN